MTQSAPLPIRSFFDFGGRPPSLDQLRVRISQAREAFKTSRLLKIQIKALLLVFAVTLTWLYSGNSGDVAQFSADTANAISMFAATTFLWACVLMARGVATRRHHGTPEDWQPAMAFGASDFSQSLLAMGLASGRGVRHRHYCEELRQMDRPLTAFEYRALLAPAVNENSSITKDSTSRDWQSTIQEYIFAVWVLSIIILGTQVF